MKDFKPPAFVVYMFGHLRSFQHISSRQRQQFDELAAGEPYLVFMHTWSERDHDRRVWYRSKRSQGEESAAANFSALEVLRDPARNALLDVMAASSVEPHPGLEVSAEALNVTRRDRKLCDAKRGWTCVSDSAQQFDELARTHRLAVGYLRSTRWYARLGESRLRALTVLRTRPDVTLRTDTVRGTVNEATYAPLDTMAAFERNLEVKRAEVTDLP